MTTMVKLQRCKSEIYTLAALAELAERYEIILSEIRYPENLGWSGNAARLKKALHDGVTELMQPDPEKGATDGP